MGGRRVGQDESLAERLAAHAFELAGQRPSTSTGPFWYDNMLRVLKDVITARPEAEKARQLARLAAGDRAALYEARCRVLAEYGQGDRAKLAAALLTTALLVRRP
jgi:hypothetical protein